jgi:predicted neuraminidase
MTILDENIVRPFVLFPLFLVVTGMSLQAAGTSAFIFENAPFPSAHASTVVELPNGDVLAAWFGGTAEGKPDVAIWFSLQAHGSWSAPSVLVREPHVPCYNPVLFFTHDGRLWLYYKFGPSPSEWTAGRRWSDDDGKTWSAVEHLPAGLYGPIRAKPLVLPDGVVVSGSSVESYGSWAAWIERSTDNAKTWFRIGPITPSASAPAGPGEYGIIQPTVIDLGNGKLRLYARSTSQIGRICVSDSTDNGLTWTAARPLDVPNPNSGIDIVRLPDGRFVLAYNNTLVGRTPLNLAISRDGEHFQSFRTIASGPGEYSYPALITARNGDLLLTYTWKRERIRFVRIFASEIPK